MSFFNSRSGQIFIWMLGAGQVAVVVGSLIFSLVAVFFSRGGLLDVGGLFLAVALVAAIGVNLVVVLVAYPIRLLWKRPLSIAFMAIGSALAGGLAFCSRSAFAALEAYNLSRNGVHIRDSLTVDAMAWAATVLFMIGALYGGVFGLSYGLLETFCRYEAADDYSDEEQVRNSQG